MKGLQRNTILLTLHLEEGAKRQGIWAVLEAATGKRKISPLQLPES